MEGSGFPWRNAGVEDADYVILEKQAVVQGSGGYRIQMIGPFLRVLQALSSIVASVQLL